MPAHDEPRRALLDRLRDELGEACVVDCAGGDLDERTAAHVSGRSVGRPLAWIRPRDTSEVATTVRAAFEEGVEVVPVGRATTFWGGLDVEGALALDCTTLRHPFGIDAEARVAHVGAGWTVRELDRAARAHGLCVACRPDAGGDAPLATLLSVGATSGLGMGFGAAVDQVVGATLVTGRGEAVRMGASHMLSGHPTQLHGLPHGLSMIASGEGRGAIITELGVRLRRAPFVTTLRASLPPGALPATDAWLAMAAAARAELDLGALDSLRVEFGSHAGDGRGRLELMARSYSDESLAASTRAAERLRDSMLPLGFGGARLEPEPADARAGSVPADAYHWSFGPEEHRSRLLGGGFWGVELTVAWGAALGRTIELLSELFAELGSFAPRHRRFAIYPGHTMVSIGVHLLLDPAKPRLEETVAKLESYTPALVGLGVPYRRGSLFASALEARASADASRATHELTEAFFAALDPRGVLPGVGRRRRSHEPPR